jgi:FKBP-type peptidyl-prolyl cis-trans isomerase FkpA
MRRYLLVLLILVVALPAPAAEKLKTEEEKTLYAIGLLVYRSLAVFNLTPSELAMVEQGITDAGTGKTPAVDLAVYNAKVQELARARRQAASERMASVNKEFLDKAAKEKGAVKTPSGLVYLSIKEGSGATPGPADTVKVNYRGTLADGKEFDSSYKRGKPVEFRMDGVIKCFSEGLQKMKVGGKARLVCPASIAYGDAGAGDLILPGATLSFEIELLDVKK